MINGDVFEIRNNQRMKEIKLYWTVPVDGLVLLDVSPLSPGVCVSRRELLNFQHCIKIASFNVCVRYFVWNFKGTL